MPGSFYEPLSHLDASFLALETRTTHMHVAGAAIFESGDLLNDRGGIDIERIKAHVASKLQYIPRYRQRLAHIPYNGQPVWIDDESFNFDYHVRHTSLPKPGSDAQLKALAGRIVSQQLDRSKPLWELWVVEGFEDDRFAVIAKIHHCMIDGIAGVDLTTILLNVVPTKDVEPSPDWEPRPAPNTSELAVAELAKTTRRAIDSLGSLPSALRKGPKLLGSALQRVTAVRSSLESGWLTPAARTPINPEVGPSRRFDWTEMPLDGLKAIKNNLGGTVNDVVLAIVAGAVRSFLQEHRGFPTDDTEFRVMAPVSVRKSSDRGQLGNQVAMWLVSLPLAEPDPVERLEAIKAETLHLKKTNQALGAATLVDLSRGTPIPLLSLAARLASGAVRPFNMTVTNVPGPQFPMYLLEAKMLANYPIVPLWHYHGLGLALFSYDSRLLWGIHADYDAVTDTDVFAGCLHESFNELLSASP